MPQLEWHACFTRNRKGHFRINESAIPIAILITTGYFFITASHFAVIGWKYAWNIVLK